MTTQNSNANSSQGNPTNTLGNQYSLTMIRGARAVYIGLFPSAYRARTVAFRLGWNQSWQPFIAKV